MNPKITSAERVELEALRNHLFQSKIVLFSNERIIEILKSKLVKSTESMNAAADEIEALRAENARLTNNVIAMHDWLAAYQPDLFKRGIWTPIDAAIQAEAKDQP